MEYTTPRYLKTSADDNGFLKRNLLADFERADVGSSKQLFEFDPGKPSEFNFNLSDFNLLVELFTTNSYALALRLFAFLVTVTLVFIGIMFGYSAYDAFWDGDHLVAPFSAAIVNILLSAVLDWESFSLLNNKARQEFAYASSLFAKAWLFSKYCLINGFLAFVCVPPYASLSQTTTDRAVIGGYKILANPFVQYSIYAGVLLFHYEGTVPLTELLQNTVLRMVAPSYYLYTGQLLQFDYQAHKLLEKIQEEFTESYTNYKTYQGQLTSGYISVPEQTNEHFNDVVNVYTNVNNIGDTIGQAYWKHGYQWLNGSEKKQSLLADTTVIFNQAMINIANKQANNITGDKADDAPSELALKAVWFITVAGFIPYFRVMATEPVGLLKKVMPWPWTVLISTIVTTVLCQYPAKSALKFIAQLRNIIMGKFEQDENIRLLSNKTTLSIWAIINFMLLIAVFFSTGPTYNLSNRLVTNDAWFHKTTEGQFVLWIWNLLFIFISSVFFNGKGCVDLTDKAIIESTLLDYYFNGKNRAIDNFTLDQIPDEIRDTLFARYKQRCFEPLENLPPDILNSKLVDHIQAVPRNPLTDEQKHDLKKYLTPPVQAPSKILAGTQLVATLGLCLSLGLVIFDQTSSLGECAYYGVIASVLWLVQTLGSVAALTFEPDQFGQSYLSCANFTQLLRTVTWHSFYSVAAGFAFQVVMLNWFMHYLNTNNFDSITSFSTSGSGMFDAKIDRILGTTMVLLTASSGMNFFLPNKPDGFGLIVPVTTRRNSDSDSDSDSEPHPHNVSTITV